MKKLFAVFVFLFSILVTPFARAVTVYYQPTPYPTTLMSQDITVVHAWDGWLPSVYYGKTLQRDSRLQVGGWGDQYRTYIKFDLAGLPQSVDQALIYLTPYARGDSSTPTSYGVCVVASPWGMSLTWNTQPSFNTPCYAYAAPKVGTWSGFWLSYPGGSPNWYNSWMNGTLANNGVMLFPQAVNNNFDVFHSTLYNDYANDPYADSRRPLLQLTFTPPVTVPNFKMPLPRNVGWLVTTEVGGWDCTESGQDSAHTGLNYFSVDFSWRNKNINGNQVYGNPDSGTMIPVTPAADGQVTEVGNNPNAADGYYVVVSHDQGRNVKIGFSTRYLHMKNPPSVIVGTFVTQGTTVLGYMGCTGMLNGKPTCTGPHLHFGIRYNNDGNATAEEIPPFIFQ